MVQLIYDYMSITAQDQLVNFKTASKLGLLKEEFLRDRKSVV